jgi:hypothetical protein
MSMGAIVGISEEEYLGTAYEPDCEFADGVLIDRNSGEQDHSWLQTALAGSRKVEDRILRVPDSPISVPLDGLDE